jgi:hypothetical protein
MHTLSKRVMVRCMTWFVVTVSSIVLAVVPGTAHVGTNPRAAAAVVSSSVSRAGSAPIPGRTAAVTPNHLSYLDAVACTTSVFCVAAGYSTDAAGHAKTLIESWDGRRWSLNKSPNVVTSDYNQLYAVSCRSSVSCAAVGRAHDSRSGFQQTLTESWNGRRWTIVPSFDTSTHADNVLDAVSCTRAGACVAVGYAANTKIGVWRTLVESWNGRAWKAVPSSNFSATENNYLLGVSCGSRSDCTAAGYHYKSRLHTLVESWDGRRWSIITSANALTTGANILYGVSCISHIDCIAVGSFYVPVETTPTNQNLIESWDGRRWALMRSPVTSTTERNTLNGISCVAHRQCVAVGTYLNHRNGYNQTLILTDRGSGWTIASSPNAGSSSRAEDNWLNGVYCISRNNCTAVGYSTNTKAISQTLIETWNGHRWTIANAANL